MKNGIGRGAFAALMLGLAAVASPASADTVYASANYTGAETGAYVVDASNFVAAQFTLTQATNITDVGGVFTAFGDGNPIFAAIISAANLGSASSSTIGSLALGHSVFAPPSDNSDATTSLGLTLAPGTYDVVFGSGAFGATGASGLATGQDGAPTLFQTVDGGSTWTTFSDSVRITVSGTPAVPLPAALPLLGTALGGLFGLVGRRRRVLA